MKTLVLGGVRSGKSRLASRLASESGKPVVFLATARAGDDEMRARIEKHRKKRPAHWRVVEEPVHLADALGRFADQDAVLLVDCLTIWLTNLLCAEDEALLRGELDALIEHMAGIPNDIVLVSNETGMGIVPADALSRRFCDEAGMLHQKLAGLCDEVLLVVAGLAHPLKSSGQRRD